MGLSIDRAIESLIGAVVDRASDTPIDRLGSQMVAALAPAGVSDCAPDAVGGR